jgi:diguanylate cyclase (GGDEF)-like protein
MSSKSPVNQPVVPQERPEQAPQGWPEAQDKLADAEGLALLLVEGRQPPSLATSHNNSICQAFQTSKEHAHLCAPYCGAAHEQAMQAGSKIEYKCHAGLQCFAVPVQLGRRRDLAVIGGRAYLSAADYRGLVERFRGGELEGLSEPQTFSNVIFSDKQRLEQLADRLERLVTTFITNEPPDQTPPAQARAATTKKTEASHGGEVAGKSNSEAAMQAELSRLRGEVEYHSRLSESLQHFLERISSSDPAKTYAAILKNSRALLHAERASLLVFDEISNELVVKAAFGLSAEPSEIARQRLGEGISGSVLETSKPLLVTDDRDISLKLAPEGRNYRTTSFISYPITIGGRKIGVLNVTDKAGGGKFDEVDLSLLEIIGPQIAVALERAEWQERATEFQLMSITDPLTSLPNRRYMEERLSEELNRSKRYDYPMSFLMIDIDDFKTYNDLNGHQAGDLALQITAHCLKATLRAADVASRYGGEEFCILLPQTPLNEAEVIAERIRQRVANTSYPHGKSQPLETVTISIGISTFSRYIDTSERVIAAADRALYSAKHLGKNRIEVYQENLSQRG